LGFACNASLALLVIPDILTDLSKNAETYEGYEEIDESRDAKMQETKEEEKRLLLIDERERERERKKKQVRKGCL